MLRNSYPYLKSYLKVIVLLKLISVYSITKQYMLVLWYERFLVHETANSSLVDTEAVGVCSHTLHAGGEWMVLAREK